MSQLQRVILSARRRLWVSRWLNQFSFAAAIAAGIFALLVLVERSFAAPIPLMLCGAGLAFLTLLASLVWLSLTKETELEAAARLDEAAGLRERISSAWHFRTVDDPFARAVVGDAEHLSRGLSTKSHLRLQSPRPLGWTMTALVVCAAMFLVPHGWLAQSTAKVADAPAELEQTQIAVEREMEELKQLAEKTPALREFSEELNQLDKEAGGDVKRPIDVRHEAVKKIDRLSDALKEKREGLKQEAAQEMRRLLRRVPGPEDKQADTEKMAQALRQGDYKSAKEELKALKEKLAKLEAQDGEKEKEQVEQLRKQLDELGKQIEKAAEAQKEEQKLQQQLGMDDKAMERLVEQLKKGDLEQARKELEKSGLTPEQAQKMAEKMQQRQQAGELAKKLAQAMKGAAQSGEQSADASASESLQMAEAQLSELEMMDQQMAELDAAMASLDEARESLDKPCSSCKGTGKQGQSSCSKCQGKGMGEKPGRGGMGKRAGQGEGGLAPEEATDVDFKKEKQKVTSGKGAIIGQVLVDGEQVKGDANPQLGEIASAAERDASDRINRDRVPRQYQKAVKGYFSTMREAMGGKETPVVEPPAKHGDAPATP